MMSVLFHSRLTGRWFKFSENECPIVFIRTVLAFISRGFEVVEISLDN